MAVHDTFRKLIKQEGNNNLAHLPFVIVTLFFGVHMAEIWIEESAGTLYDAQLSAQYISASIKSIWPPVIIMSRGFIILLSTLLLLPVVYILIRFAVYYIRYPQKAVEGKEPPYNPLLSFEWVFTGVVVTILPLSVYNLGIWGVSIVISFIIVAIPYLFSLSSIAKQAATILSGLSFLYLHSGDIIHKYISFVPRPVTLWPSVLGITMTPTLANILEKYFNSLIFGPIMAMFFATIFMFISEDRLVERIDGVVVVESYPTILKSAVVGSVITILIRYAFIGHAIIVP